MHAEEQAKALAKENEAREAVKKMKHAQISTITVETFGHTTIETVPSRSDANAKIKCEELSKPFLVCDSGINEFLGHAKIKPIMDKFGADFPASEVCKWKSRTFSINAVAKCNFEFSINVVAKCNF